MKTEIIQENDTKLKVPDNSFYGSPVDAPVFFNPEMKINRSVTTSFVKRFEKKVFADSLCATGASGVRAANEAEAKVVLNDHHPKAVSLAEENLELNDLKGETSHEKTNPFLSDRERSFDFVDIDPFGSPAPFIDSGCISLGSEGVLGVTATDTGALSGSFRNAGIRRYGVDAFKTGFYKEFGVRALAGFCVRAGGRHEIGLKPVLGFGLKHFYRVFLKKAGEKEKANELVKKVDYIRYCSECGYREFDGKEKCCEKKTERLGPVWSGELNSSADEIDGVDEESDELLKGLGKEREELMFNVHFLCKKKKVPPPSMEELRENVEEKGFEISRTHFSEQGLKTDMDFDEFYELL